MLTHDEFSLATAAIAVIGETGCSAQAAYCWLEEARQELCRAGEACGPADCAELVCDHSRYERSLREVEDLHAAATAEAALERAAVPAADATTDGEGEFPW